MVGAPTLFALLTTFARRPRARIPSIGYSENSEDTFEASPKVKGNVLDKNVTESVASVPLTEPDPYDTEKAFEPIYMSMISFVYECALFLFFTCKLGESLGPYVL
jgi:hypothetical protein